MENQPNNFVREYWRVLTQVQVANVITIRFDIWRLFVCYVFYGILCNNVHLLEIYIVGKGHILMYVCFVLITMVRFIYFRSYLIEEILLYFALVNL